MRADTVQRLMRDRQVEQDLVDLRAADGRFRSGGGVGGGGGGGGSFCRSNSVATRRQPGHLYVVMPSPASRSKAGTSLNGGDGAPSWFDVKEVS